GERPDPGTVDLRRLGGPGDHGRRDQQPAAQPADRAHCRRAVRDAGLPGSQHRLPVRARAGRDGRVEAHRFERGGAHPAARGRGSGRGGCGRRGVRLQRPQRLDDDRLAGVLRPGRSLPVPALFLLASALMVLNALLTDPGNTAVTLLIIVAGVPAYWLRGRLWPRLSTGSWR